MEVLFDHLARAAAKVGTQRLRSPSATSPSAVYRQLPDDALNQALWQLGELQRATEALSAVIAGEMLTRDEGRADVTLRRIRGLTRASGDTVERLLRVGTVVAETEQAIDAAATFDEAQPLWRERGVMDAAPSADEEGDTPLGSQPVQLPWAAPVALAVVAGELSAETAGVILRGLAPAVERADVRELQAAAESLVLAATEHTPEWLERQASKICWRLSSPVSVAGRVREGREYRLSLVRP
ncbi:hypothetical protein ALI44B_14080 [Leifsonia sp. ALI-44-B]|uniref:hypothetical protein n=1 Tax=Leifsonia sp. ALI-44-B TaxID=1933776 RepID=UPI00097BE3D1|nr:hypothetical protein [Leifsonia sp. ALI-44-B]ONI61528.1 hypothetical protein ALI44B_14080 [Leifsonia sp. ALI-44-B]